jgi:hypothetical protein
MKLINKLIENLPFDDYRALDLLNKSTLNNFVPGQSPRQQMYSKDSSGFSDGTAFHSAMEHGIDHNPDLIVSHYDSFRTNESKIWKVKQETLGKYVVTQELLNRLSEARAMTHATILDQMGFDIDDGQGQHELTGVTATEKIRLDYTRPEYHIDWKSTGNAKPEACFRDIENYNYDLQSVLYTNVYEEITGEYRPFLFAFQEIKAPFNCTLIEVSKATPEAWALGEHKYNSALARMDNVKPTLSYTDNKQMYIPNKYTLDKYGVAISPFN